MKKLDTPCTLKRVPLTEYPRSCKIWEGKFFESIPTDEYDFVVTGSIEIYNALKNVLYCEDLDYWNFCFIDDSDIVWVLIKPPLTRLAGRLKEGLDSGMSLEQLFGLLSL